MTITGPVGALARASEAAMLSEMVWGTESVRLARTMAAIVEATVMQARTIEP